MNAHPKNLLILVALVPLGLSTAVRTAEAPPHFEHQAHEGSGADCRDCHNVPEEGRATPTLLPGGCGQCHDDGRGAYSSKANEPSRGPFSFPHAQHVAEADCRDCHAQTLALGGIGRRPLVPLSRCQECHAKNDVQVGDKCEACHGVDMRFTRPPDHSDAAWTRSHGKESAWRDASVHGKDCRLCHQSGTCRNCHQTMRPASHTGLWRMRVHGMEAGWSQNSCRTCHETGACVRCHRETRPLNHTGSWSQVHGLAAQTRDNRHCTTCHDPGECTSCHGK